MTDYFETMIDTLQGTPQARHLIEEMRTGKVDRAWRSLGALT